jgi:hypothetical protein
MENLTAKEEMILMESLRYYFDLPSTDEKGCQVIISIAQKNRLPIFFINQLKNDLEC